MIIVTGASGFIGSNLVHALNARGEREVLVVDAFERGRKFRNLLGASFVDVLEKSEFLALLARDDATLERARAVFHLGACSSTTEWNGRYLLENNYAYSKAVLHWASRRRVPMIYASSAAIYGASTTFREAREHEGALNAYGWSKQIFDDYVRRHAGSAPVVGLRYFNVYGPREAHKGPMASVAYHFHQQLRDSGRVRLFGEYGGHAPGEQRRDFVYVDDVVDTNLYFLDQPGRSGIFNVGTGRAQTFNDVARAVIAHHARGEIEYVPMPDHLRGNYQSFTEADLTQLRAAGYARAHRPVEAGVATYLGWLDRHPEASA